MTFRYVERPAPPAIAAAVECVWSVSDPVRRPGRAPDRILPDGCPELIVHLGPRFARRIDGRAVRQPAAFLAGTLSRPWIIQAPARVATIGVRFRPGGFTALFGGSLAGTTDREVPLDDLPPAARELVAAIRGAGAAPASRMHAAERWLLAFVSALPHGLRPPLCLPAVRLVQRRRGRIAVGALADAVGLPPRRLERLFRRETALSPKQYIRIVRLSALLRQLEAPDRARLVDLAMDAGYFDQAHLAREFRALAARRASAARADDGELSMQFTRPDRLARLLLDA